MKAKLIKNNTGYHLWLNPETKEQQHIASDNPVIDDWGVDLRKYKLSKQNCDEIFGVVDVEKLAEECSIDWEGEVMEHIVSIYKEGFNKAMELNKENTRRVVYEIMNYIGEEYQGAFRDPQGLELIRIKEKYFESDRTLESFLEPNEIEVEIVMDAIPADRAPNGWDTFPKLDSEGCLILKKI